MTYAKPYKENEDDYVYLKVAKKNLGSLIKNTIAIQKRLVSKDVESFKLLNETIPLFEPKDAEMYDLLTAGTKYIAQEVVDYFIEDKFYYFSSYNKLIEGEGWDIPNENGVSLLSKTKSKIKISFEEMIEIAVSPALFQVMTNKNFVQADCINICYPILNSYNKKIKDKLSHSGMTIISGYIAMKLGFTLSKGLKNYSLENNQPTNAEIKGAVIYHTNKLRA